MRLKTYLDKYNLRLESSVILNKVSEQVLSKMTSNIHRYQVKMKVSHHLLKENAKYSDIDSANRKQTYENSVYILNRIFKQYIYYDFYEFCTEKKDSLYGSSLWTIPMGKLFVNNSKVWKRNFINISSSYRKSVSNYENYFSLHVCKYT